jgi:hypothetical protein
VGEWTRSEAREESPWPMTQYDLGDVTSS